MNSRRSAHVTAREPRPIILVAKAPRASLSDDIRDGKDARAEYLVLADRIGADLYTFHDLAGGGAVVSLAQKVGGQLLGLAMLGVLRGGRAPFIYVTGEDIGMRLALLHRLLGRKRKIVAVVHNIDTNARRKIFRTIGPSPYRSVIALATSQVKVLTGAIGFDAGSVTFLPTWIDEFFFRGDAPHPPPRGTDEPPKVFPVADSYALAIGMESRDYPTLQRAMAMPQFSHITMHVVASGWSPGAGYARASGISDASNITVSSGYTSQELRMLYAGARLVVVPLNQVTYAAGVTGILEGMAMSKAVVASDSPGIRDYTRDGKCGAVVPCRDADALGAAIAKLWDDPSLAKAVGNDNRRWVEATTATDLYVESVATLTGVR